MIPTTRIGANPDLPPWVLALTATLVLGSLAALVLLELRRHEGRRAVVGLTGALALLALGAAVLRPVRVASKETVVGAKVVVLADRSRSMAIPDEGGTRATRRDLALAALGERAGGARISVLGFGEGPPTSLATGDTSAAHSDLGAALRALAASAEERPEAVVVVSDGRLDEPGPGATADDLRALTAPLGVPVHVVPTTTRVPRDASVRRVAFTGAAVAHVPLPLHVEVGCDGGLSCDELTVTARELRDDGPPALLASGLAHVEGGRGALDLPITLDRAGARLVEVALAAPSGDEIPQNDRRLLTVSVARDRVRVLHVAGRPTNDVRALRDWLKGNASVDVVAFFILRTPTDDPRARQEDLALIPFPVDELFTEHLQSFDAVVLQDFDAQPYGLERHLPALARYVRDGGGLVMVGGPNAFVAGGYAGTALADVLPVELDPAPGATSADLATLVPVWTEAGLGAPLLAPLRAVTGEELPEMPGANVLGAPKDGAVALWAHPTRRTDRGAMPLLAVREVGSGRSLALGLDGAWQLGFSALGARTNGRGYGALWDGLLGWLMRDPRYEPGQVELAAPCLEGQPATLRLTFPRPLDQQATPRVLLARLDAPEAPRDAGAPTLAAGARGAEVVLPPLPAGAWSVRLDLNAMTTRKDFACEAGGDEWADSRPDPDRLAALARASGGTVANAAAPRVPLPRPTTVSAERHTAPLAPPWVWSAVAALALGAHWLVRRRDGLA